MIARDGKDAPVCRDCKVPRILGPRTEESKTLGWRCPCCRSVMLTGEMLRAAAELGAAERGITLDEYHAELREMFRDFDDEPLTEAESVGAAESASRHAEEWVAPCEHVKNPWTTPVEEMLGDGETQ